VKLPLEFIISGLTAATMLAVGLELDIHRIPDIVRRKFLLPGLLLGQMLLLPAVAICVVRIVPMPESTKFVVLMLSACPTGNIANFFTLLARGDLALTVLASATSCLLAPGVMPVTFAIYRLLLGMGFPFMVPAGALLTRIFALTWAPIFLGLALRSVHSSGMARFSTGLRHACATGTVALCVFISATRAGQLTTDWKTNVTVSAMLVLAALAGAVAIARGLRLATDDAISYMTSFPARHIGVLAAVTVTTLHRLDDLVFILVYFIVETAVIMTVVGIHRWRSSLQPLAT
jgi:bile acid:Na+ symporter, BASS family